MAMLQRQIEMARLLLLRNNSKQNTVLGLEDRFSAWGIEVDSHWAYGNEFPASLESYDGIVLSGGPNSAYDKIEFVEHEHALVREAEQANVPMLGICLGSQILASALCGEEQVYRRQTCEVGYKWLDARAGAKNDPICRDIGSSFYMFVWHNDEIRADHPDINVLAESDVCPNHVWRFGESLIWGIQGHPEIRREEARPWFDSHRHALEKDGANLENLIRTADKTIDAESMLRNFALLCRDQTS
jgi:GMP synthase (glutamine-hydrolysing)